MRFAAALTATGTDIVGPFPTSVLIGMAVVAVILFAALTLVAIAIVKELRR